MNTRRPSLFTLYPPSLIYYRFVSMFGGSKHLQFKTVRAASLGLPLLVLWLLLAAAWQASGASMTATLDRGSVVTGESATLTLTFEGGEPDALPAFNLGPNMRVASQGTSRNMSVVAGQIRSTISQTYLLTPLQPGVYQIPALQTTIQGQPVASQPIKLTAAKPSDSEPAYMRLFIPQKQVFLGQAITVELQVFVRDGILNGAEILRAFDAYNQTPITAEGCRILRMAHANQRRAQVDGVPYTVATLVTAITPAKTGKLAIESIKVPLTLQMPIPGQRRRDIFDPFGMFQRGQPREVVLAAPGETLEVSPLPADKVPPGFKGAVGSFTLTMDAGPTNIAVGDPITVRVRIDGKGDLESLVLPEQEAWSDFKTYPPTSKIESTDPLGLQGAKIFEQVVVAQSEQIKALPKVSFSFFDADKKAYQTLTSSAVPLVVRPGGSTPAPTVAMSRGAREEEPPPAADIVPIKRKLNSGEGPSQPLINRPSFLVIQLVPIFLLAGTLTWRRRADALAANPRLLRKREVDRKIRSGMADLRRFAAENNSEQFFLTVFRLMQEQIGERLDVPASSITEAVVEDRLRPKGVSEDTLSEIQQVFQICDQARYAPVRSSQQLEALVPNIEAVLEKLRRLSL